MFDKDSILAAAAQAPSGRCVTGLVTHMATKRRGIIVVVDGQTYHLDDGAIAPGVDVGKHVQLTVDGRNEVIASKVVTP